MIMKLYLALLLLAAPTFVSAQTIADMLAADPDLSTISDLIATVGLSDDLAGAGPFTVFAPTNAAFALVDTSAMDTTRLVSYHVLVGEGIPRNGFVTGTETVLSGDQIDIAKGFYGKIFIAGGGAQITGTSMQASNGYIHKLNKVLSPPKVLPVVNMNGNALYDEGGAFDPSSITVMDPDSPFDANIATVPPVTTTGTTGGGGGGGAGAGGAPPQGGGAGGKNKGN